MAHAPSPLHFEIQNLKDALAASHQQADKYAHLIASLSYELDNLRSNMCHSCKNKLTPSKVSVPSITVLDSTCTTSVSAPLRRRGRQRSRPTIDNAPSIGLPHSLAAAPNSKKPLSLPSEPIARTPQATPTHPGPNRDKTSSKQNPMPPKWSVIHHPEVEQALELHLMHTFTYASPAHCVKMSPDGQTLAVGDRGSTYLYELQTGSNICTFVDRYVKSVISILSAQFSPDGRLLATGATDGQVRIWDITIKRMRAIFKGHKYQVNSVAFSPNGRSLVSASSDRSARIWNTRDGSSKVLPITGQPEYFFSVAFSPDGRHIAAGNFDNSLWMWDSRTHTLVARWEGHTSDVRSTGFTPDGKGLMSGGSDNTIKYWDVSSLGIRQGVSTRAADAGGVLEVRRFVGHDSRVRSIAFFPGNTRWIVTGSNDRSVRIWDAQSGVCHLRLQGHVDWVRGVDVSQRENFLATAGIDGHVTVWKYKLL